MGGKKIKPGGFPHEILRENSISVFDDEKNYNTNDKLNNSAGDYLFQCAACTFALRCILKNNYE